MDVVQELASKVTELVDPLHLAFFALGVMAVLPIYYGAHAAVKELHEV